MNPAGIHVAAETRASPFSLDGDMLRQILAHARPLGHCERAADLNLGFGFVYYGLVRALRPAHVVVIGSGYGFSVVCLALALKDNRAGALSFVDPSYSVLHNGPIKTIGGVDFWRNPEQVRAHFAQFGVADIVTHYKQTSEEFFDRYKEIGLPKIDLAFIDGNHSYAHVQHDVVAALRHSRKNTYFLLHDTHIYVREFLRHAGVKRWLRKKAARHKAAFEYVDFPFASGVAVLRVLEPKVRKQLS
jgi:pimeloyl-ACP methyl ester carboxylesterase